MIPPVGRPIRYSSQLYLVLNDDDTRRYGQSMHSFLLGLKKESMPQAAQYTPITLPEGQHEEYCDNMLFWSNVVSAYIQVTLVLPWNALDAIFLRSGLIMVRDVNEVQLWKANSSYDNGNIVIMDRYNN